MGGGLVMDVSQEDVQVVLKQGVIPRILIFEGFWEQVEQMGTMDTEGLFPCPYHSRGGIPGYIGWNSQPTPPVTPLPSDSISLYQPQALC